MDLSQQSSFILKKIMELSLKRKEVFNILRRINEKLKRKNQFQMKDEMRKKIEILSEEFEKIRENYCNILK